MKATVLVFLSFICGSALGIYAVGGGFIQCLILELLSDGCEISSLEISGEDLPTVTEAVAVKASEDIFRSLTTFTLFVISLAAGFLYFVFDKVVVSSIEERVKERVEEEVSNKNNEIEKKQAEYDRKLIEAYDRASQEFDVNIKLNKVWMYYETSLSRWHDFESAMLKAFRGLGKSRNFEDTISEDEILSAERIAESARTAVNSGLEVVSTLQASSLNSQQKEHVSEVSLNLKNYKIYCNTSLLIFADLKMNARRNGSKIGDFVDDEILKYALSKDLTDDIDEVMISIEKTGHLKTVDWYYPYETLAFACYSIGVIFSREEMKNKGEKMINDMFHVERFPFLKASTKNPSKDFLNGLRSQYGGIILEQ